MVKVAGRPLISYSLEVAKEALGDLPNFTVFVSTDSEEIQQFAIAEGIEVPFLRPDEFAGDRSPSIEFVLHALKEFSKRGKEFDAVMILQPTSPMRTAKTVRDAISLLEKNPSADSLITAFEDPSINLDTYYQRTDEGFGLGVTENHNTGGRRQDLMPTYVRNGAVYIVKTDYLERTGKLIADRPLVLVMDEAVSINVDGPDDLAKLKEVLEK
tara:strand:- start:1256 stop:1894 length:639 start_codon:yes stop_codon:yes gene_type:complete